MNYSKKRGCIDMGRKVEYTSRYLRAVKTCKKKHLDLKPLREIETILATRPFTKDEIVQYKVHNLSGNFSGCTELHIGHKRSDWLLIYRVVGDTVKFEDTYVVLENTGTHDECFGDIHIVDGLVWI